MDPCDSDTGSNSSKTKNISKITADDRVMTQPVCPTTEQELTLLCVL